MIYASDRKEPKHVHVSRGDGYGKVWLEPEVDVQYLVYFKAQEKKEILEIIERNAALLKAKWDEFFKEQI